MKILTDTHSHTVASTHAYSTVHDYFTVAKQKGLQLFSITDHAPSMPDGPHYWHFGNMKVIPRVVDNVAMLRGIEANILEPDGEVDIPPNLDPFLDFAIASFHEPVFTPVDEKTHTRAVIKAMGTGLCQIIGHPGNPNYPINFEEVVRAARDHNVLLEINNSSFLHSRSGSEARCIHLLEIVDRLDWKVVFGSDAHVAYQVGEVGACIDKAQAIGFPEARVVSANARRLLSFLAEHDKPVTGELAAWFDGLESDTDTTSAR
ncbi:phosphatase [Exilibacterium tricleocarpae]|uniref:Phosphatase n=1 Tax=Exilibacterium tricleocarpae TaxID=2591008 RepID=A0A545T683_9GAMM|nr:phosphatase [Exilibacterium tricleocarpae]TQV72698.1 phosphatase [Exilibacterium tricleocarpae]